MLPSPPAQAATLGVGYGNEQLWLGSFSSNGRQAYCMDIDALPPFGNTQHPELQTTLDNLTSVQLAQLNYTMGRWGESLDPAITAAVQLFVWDVADHETYVSRGGDGNYITWAPAEGRSTVLANLAVMRSEAAANAVMNPSASASIEMSDQYNGQLTIATLPASLQGTATLTNATFENGATTATLGAGTHRILGTPSEGAPEYRIGASFSAQAAGLGAGVDLFYTPGEQRILGTASFEPVTATAQTPMIPLDFQPEITTQVSAKFVAQGDPFVDGVTVRVTKHSWIAVNGSPIAIEAVGKLYGPFDEQPAEANAPPAGAPLAGTEQLTLTGPGTYTSPGTIIAPESGFYTWVWSISKEAQGANSKYLTASFTDKFGLVPETSVTPFRPEAVSKANQKLVKPGDAVTDTITVSSTNGRWLKHDGVFIPVTFEGTAYQVPGTLPPSQNAAIPADAQAVASATVTATGPGVYTSSEVVVPAGGFVTWVWEMKKQSQPVWIQPYLAADWADDYGITVETHSVRWPIQIVSEIKEYNVHLKGGRAFDRIEMTGFPDNHGTFTGDGYWNADVDEVTHTVYGPFTTEDELTDSLDLATAPTLTSITTPARNGTYQLGYTAEDAIKPVKPGYYVIVSVFVGDDRVQPFMSSPADIRERFFVPGDRQPVTVITQATPEVRVDEPFEDLALVQGTDIPEGAYLQFRAYGPQAPGETPVCDTPFFTSDKIAVTQAGIYHSGTTTTNTAGNVYWVETLYSATGKVIAEGTCGAPGETTVVLGQAEAVTVVTNEVVPGAIVAPKLADTGSNSLLLPFLLTVSVACVAAAIMLFSRRRTSQLGTDSDDSGDDDDSDDTESDLPHDVREDGDVIDTLLK
ncbi:hypothetical protein G7066_08895 [Leucobacter coleopterorum]|uniref:LPXTG-motif cell wall anchor domain-containing protein n=1 Tax=Leucobacter coleopterorum TaxID=2714933 RepID=A0ABX6JYK9_9MICO|nr:hypothetical protein [Leucobacter coleopterorum]QIM18698.1 hypothetical protein G7066_08895 [Leucobacter coleopterorum]